ncbi:MAG TPA: carboxymuconolactone decarboxylase family protein [Nevskia sp.]|nr:carboxymuconolactone decarboxylase family protein [Nevskia sp.]
MKKYDREKGLELFDEVYAKSLGQLPPAGVSEFTDYMLETLFGSLWADERLSIRERRLMLLGVAAAQGDENILGIQIRSALARGELKLEQLEPLAVFLTQYVGYPRGSRLYLLVSKIKAELAEAKK